MSSNSNRRKKGLEQNDNARSSSSSVMNKLGILSKNKTFLGIVTIIIVIALIAVVLDVSGLIGNGITGSNGNSSNNPSSGLPPFIKAGEFAKISSKNIGTNNQVNIYFMSWRGCPIGAAESWIWHQYINQSYHSTGYIISYHYSDPAEKLNNIPGLLFNNFSFNNGQVQINFHVDYVYPEQFPQTPSEALVYAGMNTLNRTSGFPNAALTDLINFQTVVPTDVTSTVNEPLANYAGHLTTCIIISGNNGTYFLEGALYSPTVLSGYSPSYMFNNSASFSQINSGVSYISQIVGDAQ